MTYQDMNTEELKALKDSLTEQYEAYKALSLKLNMARGKPSRLQLELSMPLLDIVSSDSDLYSEDGTDCCNYGVMDGIIEAKKFMGEIMNHDPRFVCVFGNSSLNIMYDLVAMGYIRGYGNAEPWSQCENRRWICPVPGYDRHFAITEAFGFDMIPVPLIDGGLDMDLIEKLVIEDENIKGIWCVPQYSNPSGHTYSDDVVHRLATMPCAADDFRIFWDNAYCVHDLDDSHHERVLDIAEECERAGHSERYFKFASTSKVTLPGAGIAAVAACENNYNAIKKHIGIQTVGYDKLNQLRHVRFLKDKAGVLEHMRKHAAIIKPKFDLVEEKLTAGLADTGVAQWTHPHGGYFVSFDGINNTAQRTVALAKEAGVVMTGAGATWPLKHDPHDSNIRIAPTLPPLEELNTALDVFVCCVKLAAVEELLK